MKKPFTATFRVAFLSLLKVTQMKSYGCVAIIFLAGCAALDTHQAKLDQKQLRDVLMDYTEDQILDNLIRARNGLPIVHYDLSHITAAVTSKFTPAVGGGRSVSDVRTRTPTHGTTTTGQTTNTTMTTTVPVNQTVTSTVMNTMARTVSVLGGVVETVAKPFTYNVTAERDNAIGVEAAPVLDKPEVMRRRNSPVLSGTSAVV